MNKKLKLFLENFLFYGGLSMLQKALPFITLPIITRLLKDPTSYGIADMFNLIISFGSAIAVLGIYDAVFREFFEDKENREYQKRVTATGLNIVLISGTIIMISIILCSTLISKILFKSYQYKNLVILSAIGILISTLNSLIISPTRMRNQRKIFFITGITFPILGFIITYVLIRLGYTYEALIYGTIGMSLISLIIFYILNKKDFSLKIFDKKIAKELFRIGLPLVPTFLIYWIFHSMDRVMINRMLNGSELGIYSVGAKVSSVSQLIYTAFAGGWSYFSFSTMKDKNQVEINSKVFEYLGIISFFVYILAQPFIKPVFNIFFEGEYIRGQEVFSFLFLSPLILMLFQTVGNQVIIIKKSYLSTLSLIIGAILNIILNFIFIKSHGIFGAAFSTLNSYMVSVVIMCIVCYKNKLFVISKRFLSVVILLLIGIYLNFFFKECVYYKIVYTIDFILIVILYFKDLKLLLKSR
ncbi:MULTISPECIES: oligosaccharide flippase family protein [Fusobacterium]|uniref:oligosaccharide flippase family protein n=1 Tax=Fusobacterium TaxID=848 RepID=UPI001476F710|nr:MULTISPECIES: oligosaccharide flippase family protein [Fusobacterium]NME35813.1 oligosaccharide flippase family protein [Fusobacterium sp. FSA-380-WT-3A]